MLAGDPLGPAVRNLLEQSLSLDPTDRPATPAQFGAALRRAVIRDVSRCDLVATAAAATDIGLGGRATNEDRFAVHLAAEGGCDGTVFQEALAVADGMGGTRFGEIASQICIEAVLSGCGDSFPALGGTASLESWRDAALAWALEMNHTVMHVGERLGAAHDFGSTLTVLFLLGARAVLVHAGDSRAFRLRGGELTCLTTAQSYAAELHAKGELSAQEAERSEFRKVLVSFVGSPQCEPQIDLLELQPGDAYLLCSDGPLDGLTESDVTEVLSQSAPEIAVGELMNRTRANQRNASLSDSSNPERIAYSDNLTLVVVRIAAAATTGRQRMTPAVRLEAHVHPLSIPIEPHERMVTVRLDVITPSEVQGSLSRPLNLSLVIDKSGTMEGAKINTAKAAAVRVVENLSDADTFCLVAFSTTSDTLVPATRVGANRQAIIDRILSLQAESKTFLAAALRAATDQLRPHMVEGTTTAAYVLTDGKVHDAADCLNLAPDMIRQGIGIRAWGIGQDYQLDFLDQLVGDPIEGKVKDLVTHVTDENLAEMITKFVHFIRRKGHVVTANGFLTINVPIRRVRIQSVISEGSRRPLTLDSQNTTPISDLPAGAKADFAIELAVRAGLAIRNGAKRCQRQGDVLLTVGCPTTCRCAFTSIEPSARRASASAPRRKSLTGASP